MTTEQMDWLDDERAGRHCQRCGTTHNPGMPCPTPWDGVVLSSSHRWELDPKTNRAQCSWCHAFISPDSPMGERAAAGAPCPARANALSLPEPSEVPQEPRSDFGAAQDRLTAAVDELWDAMGKALEGVLLPILNGMIWVARRLERMTRGKR